MISWLFAATLIYLSYRGTTLRAPVRFTLLILGVAVLYEAMQSSGLDRIAASIFGIGSYTMSASFWLITRLLH